MLASLGWALAPVVFGWDVLSCGVLALACFMMGVAWGFSEDKPFVLDKIVPIRRKTGEEKESKTKNRIK